jgi:hypothetical protein
MKTLELINTPESQLVPQLRQMKIKELERHATKLLSKLGAGYAPVLAAITRAIPDLNKVEGDIFLRFQAVIRQQLSCADSAENRELIRRLSVIMMLIVQRQFQKIHEGRSSS